MSRLRTGVLGVGRLGAEHARILRALPDSELVGVHDLDGARGEAVARRLEVRHFAEADGLLEAAEAVVVAVPTADHAPVARAALRAGCHVLVEKPLAPTLEEADALIVLAGERGRALGVGHIERFNGAVRRSEPYLDAPRFVESLRLAPFQPRGTDVTVILDLMIHDIDLVLSLVQGTVAGIHAVGVPVLSGSVDIANARLLFDSGAVANITASRVSAERKRRLRLFQRTGYLSLDLAEGQGEFLRRRSEGDGRTPETAPRSLGELVERIPLVGDDREPLELELEAFLQAARGHPSDLVPASQARTALEVALDITRQIEEFADVVVQDS